LAAFPIRREVFGATPKTAGETPRAPNHFEGTKSDVKERTLHAMTQQKNFV